mmetsp:Transcript_27614/g.32220  ORF Transcript_27614/g.32220 Transcript_27614/m.32220 type:complete len:98 (-) Transcript_27614:12-305(-)
MPSNYASWANQKHELCLQTTTESRVMDLLSNWHNTHADEIEMRFERNVIFGWHRDSLFSSSIDHNETWSDRLSSLSFQNDHCTATLAFFSFSSQSLD